MSGDPVLTQKELLHLAMTDSRNGRHDEAIIKLKRCITAEPASAAAHHLLAAEYAEIGMLQEATEEFEQVLSLDATSVAARFQLGLTYMLAGDAGQAKRAWSAIAEIERDGPWDRFRAALECLMSNEFTGALKHFDAGLAMNFKNDALRRDMSRLRDKVRAALPPDQPEASEQQANELLLRNYTRGPKN